VLSQFRGVALVDCAAFLAPVQEGELATGEAAVTFRADWKVPHDPKLQSVAIRVATTPKEHEDGEVCDEDVFGVKWFETPPCPDMPLVSPACAFSRGYRVLVGNPGAEDTDEDDEDDAYYVLDVYFDASAGRKAGGGGGSGGAGGVTGYKRVKL
jgi:hypothetical protein